MRCLMVVVVVLVLGAGGGGRVRRRGLRDWLGVVRVGSEDAVCMCRRDVMRMRLRYDVMILH